MAVCHTTWSGTILMCGFAVVPAIETTAPWQFAQFYTVAWLFLCHNH